MSHDQKIVDEILNSCNLVNDKKSLNCNKAFELSKSLNISLKDIGNICNENDVKIKNCQLGCFA